MNTAAVPPTLGPNAPSTPSPGWHALPHEEVAGRLGVSPAGLSVEEAQARLASYNFV